MRFSCIMPVYNGADFLREAIDSVLGQTYTDFELIVVDDGSTDATLQVAELCAKGDARVRVISLPHGGVSRARNRGIEEAQGDYLLFIDGDDTWAEDLLCSVNGALTEDTELLLFGMALHRLNADGTLSAIFPELPEDGKILSLSLSEEKDGLFSRLNLSSPCNKVYRTQSVKENDTRFSPFAVYLEDLKFNLDYLRRTEMLTVLQRNLYNYRVFSHVNQVRKRRFGPLFQNADALISSANTFLAEKQSSFFEMPTLTGIVRNAYIAEYLAAVDGKSPAEEKQIFSVLAMNEGFSRVTANAGKFFRLFRLLGMLHLSSLQAWLLRRKFS